MTNLNLLVQLRHTLGVLHIIIDNADNIPCTCGPEYLGRKLCAPDCPRCNWGEVSIGREILDMIKQEKSKIEQLLINEGE